MKDFAKSIRTNNSKIGNEDYTDIIRASKKQLEDAKKFGWAETGYNGWTKKDVEHLEKRIKELEQQQRTGNSKVGNSSNTKEEAKTKDEYFEILKFYQTQGYRTKAGEYNPNGRIKLHKGDDSVEIVLVGNSVPENLHERFGYRLAVTKDGDGKKQTISELEMSISDYKNEIAEKEKELNKDKQNLQKLEAVLRKYK